MSSLFDALEKLKQSGSSSGEGKAISGYGREHDDDIVSALNITPEPLMRLKWRRRISMLVIFVIVPVTLAYVAHVYDETMRDPNAKPLMNRIVSFVAGEDGVKDYVRQSVGSAKNLTGNLDKLVKPYAKLPVSETEVPAPVKPKEDLSLSEQKVVASPIVQEMGTRKDPIAEKQPSSEQTTRAQVQTQNPVAVDIVKPAFPDVGKMDIDRLIGDLPMEETNPAFNTPMTGTPLPSANEALPKYVELRRGNVTPIRGEDASLAVAYKRSIALRGLYESAQAALDAGDNVQAIILFQKILDYNRKDDVALFALAVAQQKAGQRKNALASYKRLLDITPNNLEAQANRLGLMGQEKPAEAIAQLENLVRNNPDFVSGWSQLSDLYAQQENFDAAIVARREVLALRPNSLPDLYNIAVLYDRNDNREAAIAAYRTVLRAAGNQGSGLPVAAMQQRLSYLVQ